MVASGQCFQALRGESLMKKPYQIAAGRAVQRVRQWAESQNPAVQLVLPMIEILALAKQGAGELVREAGLRIILLAMAPGNGRADGRSSPTIGGSPGTSLEPRRRLR